MDEDTLSALLHRAPVDLAPASTEEALNKALKDGRRRGRRTRATVTATVTALAAAAVATTVLLPASPSPAKTGPLADQGVRSTVKATAKPTATRDALPPVQTSASLVSYTFTSATDVTAAKVLSDAAQGARSAPDPDANAPLVNGWPQATYWHTLTQYTASNCPGEVESSNTWLGQDGSVTVTNKTTGPAKQVSKCFGPTANSTYPVMGGPSGVQLGGKVYTWAQWTALPTDPAKLWPIVQADSNIGVAPGKGGIYWTYSTIALALANYPVSPAMREALFTVMEKIPDVTVTGKYTDSLGRTGTALTLNNSDFFDWTVVIDTSNGQLLAQLTGAPPIPKGCVRASETGNAGADCTVGGSGLAVFITAGPTSTTH
jgi:hypothetical protein